MKVPNSDIDLTSPAGDISVPKSNLFIQPVAKTVLDILVWLSLDKVRPLIPQHFMILTALSIIPCLALRGVASGIARSPQLRAKILLCQ
jgi:hypothetical protein